jgi:hypothetical protein
MIHEALHHLTDTLTAIDGAWRPPRSRHRHPAPGPHRRGPWRRPRFRRVLDALAHHSHSLDAALDQTFAHGHVATGLAVEEPRFGSWEKGRPATRTSGPRTGVTPATTANDNPSGGPHGPPRTPKRGIRARTTWPINPGPLERSNPTAPATLAPPIQFHMRRPDPAAEIIDPSGDSRNIRWLEFQRQFPGSEGAAQAMDFLQSRRTIMPLHRRSASDR